MDVARRPTIPGVNAVDSRNLTPSENHYGTQPRSAHSIPLDASDGQSRTAGQSRIAGYSRRKLYDF